MYRKLLIGHFYSPRYYVTTASQLATADRNVDLEQHWTKANGNELKLLVTQTFHEINCQCYTVQFPVLPFVTLIDFASGVLSVKAVCQPAIWNSLPCTSPAQQLN